MMIKFLFHCDMIQHDDDDDDDNVWYYVAIAAPSEATKADTSGCYLMEGMLTKSNSSKEWKDRYGKLVNRYTRIDGNDVIDDRE